MKRIQFADLIIFENEDYLVINKPPHYSTLDDRAAEGKQSMLDLARAYCPTIQMGHRLDRETSGALAIAKNPEAYRHLSMQFEHRTVEKIYHAITDGLHDWKNVVVNKPILPLKTGTVKIDYAEGKPAETSFTTLEIFHKHTLVECRPRTGRMHQIRIHLTVLGAPIVQDLMYGGKSVYLSDLKRRFNLKKDTDEQPLISRVALHAYALEFKLLNGEALRVVAEYPKDIQALLNQLAKNL